MLIYQKLAFAAGEAFANIQGIQLVADMGDGSKRVKLTLAAGTSDATSVLTINTQWDATTMTPLAGTTDGAQMLYYDICSIG